jgi:hypothetical protein
MLLGNWAIGSIAIRSFRRTDETVVLTTADRRDMFTTPHVSSTRELALQPRYLVRKPRSNIHLQKRSGHDATPHGVSPCIAKPCPLALKRCNSTGTPAALNFS